MDDARSKADRLRMRAKFRSARAKGDIASTGEEHANERGKEAIRKARLKIGSRLDKSKLDRGSGEYKPGPGKPPGFRPMPRPPGDNPSNRGPMVPGGGTQRPAPGRTDPPITGGPTQTVNKKRASDLIKQRGG